MDTATMIAIDQANRQRLGSRDFDRNFLVSAGAGAGKTFLTVERAINLLMDGSGRVTPQNIVMITFTRKAATELKERMNARLRDQYEQEHDPDRKDRIRNILACLPEVQISTIHSFCQKVLNAYPLESGIGFAPLFDSEDSGPDTRSELFFNDEWGRKRFSESVALGFNKDTVYKHFLLLAGAQDIKVQYLDMSADGDCQKKEGILNECRRIIRGIRESLGDRDWQVYNPRISGALSHGNDATDTELIQALQFMTNKVPDTNEWVGKTGSKTAAKAVEGLCKVLDDVPDSICAEAEETIDGLFNQLRQDKKLPRTDFMLENLPSLPVQFRNAAELIEILPDSDSLKPLSDDMNIILHGIVTGEVLKSCERYRKHCSENHIITLDDMLRLTKHLVLNNPGVREKLHQQYKVFFVDEYQDTDPVQTDIIFGITADEFDPDWHKCRPAPGSLFLVGDAKQGIYRFRGADISLWQEAEDAMTASGGEVIQLYKNFRSTPEICGKVTEIFGAGTALRMDKSEFQAEYAGMVANREPGTFPVFTHRIEGNSDDYCYRVAAQQITEMIRTRVQNGENTYGDFFLLSFFKEDRSEYTNFLRRCNIPVKFDGKLPITDYEPLQLLNLRTQTVINPFNEALSFRTLMQCWNVSPEEWHYFTSSVKKLPDETRLNRYVNIRSLMGHTDELARLLPDTELNRHVLHALGSLDHDRKLSEQATPCGFLQAMIEEPDGLFTHEYDADEYQNQYAALLQTVDTIRNANPLSFHDMAAALKTLSETPLERMPSIRADDNYVRLMNAHKAKGLQGKVLILLPTGEKSISVNSHLKRVGPDTLGWYPLTEKNPSGFNGRTYYPDGWTEAAEREKKFLAAERTRLMYVALTRAENEVHVFEFVVMDDKHKNVSKATLWNPIAATGEPWPMIMSGPESAGDPDDSHDDMPVNYDDTSLLQPARREEINRRKFVRLTPSMLESSGQKRDQPGIEAENAHTEADEILRKPGGKEWGTLVHEAAELIVRDGRFTENSIRECAAQAAARQFPSEIMDSELRTSLLIPDQAVSPEQIRDYLADTVSSSLNFMADESSAFRRMIQDTECYPELPFMMSVGPDDPLYASLQALTNAVDGRRIEINGKIDLALRYPDGTWAVLDYKTDRMLPCDRGDVNAFHARLEDEYGPQLNAYKAVLECLTGGKTVKTSIVSV